MQALDYRVWRAQEMLYKTIAKLYMILPLPGKLQWHESTLCITVRNIAETLDISKEYNIQVNILKRLVSGMDMQNWSTE